MPSPRHRKRLRRFEGDRCLHELTFSCYRRRPLLDNEHRCEALAASLQQACESERFDLIAFVFMPEHVHLLVLPTTDGSRVARLLARTKQPASKAIKQQLADERSDLLESLTVQERPGKRCFRFWQAGAGFDRNLFSPQAVEASLHYLHANPVRRGLCEQPTDWRWSSARFHLDVVDNPRPPRLTPLAPEWFDTARVRHEPH